jgi:hypothetical protein
MKKYPPTMGAPAGTVPNFINPPDQMKGVIALHTTCLVIVTLAVALRIYTRKVIVRRLGVDDCMYCDTTLVTMANEFPIDLIMFAWVCSRRPDYPVFNADNVLCSVWGSHTLE